MITSAASAATAASAAAVWKCMNRKECSDLGDGSEEKSARVWTEKTGGMIFLWFRDGKGGAADADAHADRVSLLARIKKITCTCARARPIRSGGGGGDGVQARSWAWVLRAQSVQESSGLNVFVVSLCGTTSWRRQHHHHRCRRHRHRRLPPVAVLLLRLRRRRCGRYCCCCAFYFGNWVLKVFASSRRSAFLLSLLCSRPQSLRRHRFRNYDPIRIFWLQISFWTISTKCQMSSVELMS